jgi:hypothetical protein
MDSLKIPILKPGGGHEPLIVDFSQESNAIEVLRALAGGGWILLKRCSQVSADSTREDILSNKVRLSEAVEANTNKPNRLFKLSLMPVEVMAHTG